MLDYLYLYLYYALDENNLELEQKKKKKKKRTDTQLLDHKLLESMWPSCKDWNLWSAGSLDFMFWPNHQQMCCAIEQGTSIS